MNYHNFFSFLFPPSLPSTSPTPASLRSTSRSWSASPQPLDAEGGTAESLLSGRWEAERSAAEQVETGDGESTSLSDPELKVGDGGGREEEREGWRRKEDVNPPHSGHSLPCRCHASILYLRYL